MLTVFLATFCIFGGISSLGLEKVCDCPEPCDARKKRMAREAQRQQNRIL